MLIIFIIFTCKHQNDIYKRSFVKLHLQLGPTSKVFGEQESLYHFCDMHEMPNKAYSVPVPIRNAETLLTFQKLPKSHLFDLAARLPVDELALVSIMT